MKTQAMAGAAFGLSLLLGAGAANAQAAGAPDCVWSQTPPSMRDAMRASLRRHAEILESLTDQQVSVIMRACRLTNTDSVVGVVVATLRAHTLMLEAQEGLKASLNLDEDQISGGWRALPASDRRSLARALRTGFSMPETASTGLAVWAESLGIRTEAGKELLFDYAVGRALMDTIGDR